MDVIEVQADYCDACPAEAKVQAYLYATHTDWPGGVAYCGHHGTEYLTQLQACGATIIDMRHRICAPSSE